MSRPDSPDEPVENGISQTEAYIRCATEAANVALWSTCPETGETWYSPTWFTLLGYRPNAFTPSFDFFLELMHPDDREATRAAFWDLVEDRVPVYSADFRLRAADGGWRWIGASGAKVSRENGLPYVVYGMQIDITARKVAEANLAQAAYDAEQHRQRLARLTDNSPVALFEFRIDADEHVTLPYFTSRVHELLGVPFESVQQDGAAIFSNIVDEDMARMWRAIDESRRRMSTFKLRFRVARTDLEAGYIWVQANSVPQREPDGSTIWFGSVCDVTLEVQREAMLAQARDSMRHLALHDGLTGLPNRRRFDEMLSGRSERAGDAAPAAILIRIDLDRFKFVNDTLGHAAGDAVLVHVADILEATSGPDDHACRVGGDEFCVLMGRGRTVDDAKAVVAAAQEHLARPFAFQGKTCRFGASFGIASSAQGNIGNGDLMSFADAALYEAKAAGRGRLEVFSNALHDKILNARRLASEIETALENQQFEPFFQPQICARSGALVGMEVLARWRTDTGRIVTPDTFMPIADQIRAVPLIDRMMAERAVAIVDRWDGAGFVPPKMSFNISAGRLREHCIVPAMRTLQERGIEVAFELLESILLEEEDGVMRYNLDLARDSGICLEIDDFGTGHASILGLVQVGPDVLKIDRRLTANVVESDQARDLVASILGIARSLGIKTTAEGIETREQAAILRNLGCNVFQGYLYAKPLDADDFCAWAISNGFVSNAPAGATAVST